MKKHLLLIMLMFIMSVLLIANGCRGPKQKKSIIMRWSGYAYPKYDKFRSEESKKFENMHPEVIVKYEPISGDYNTKILTQIAGGTAPDLFFLSSAFLWDYVNRGILCDLTDSVERDKTYFAKLLPILQEMDRVNGKTYTLPANLGTNILYYNKKLFDEAGVSYPDKNLTWDKMLGLAKRLTKRDERGRIIQYGLITGLGPGSGRWLLFIFQNGGALWNRDKTECIINSPEAQEAITFLRDLYMKYGVSPTMGEVREQGNREIFIMGRAAMYLGDSWEIATFKIKGASPLEWDAVLWPKASEIKPRVYELQANRLGILSTTKYPELAYELAKFMIEPERVRFLVQVGDSLPMRNEGVAMEYFQNELDIPKKAKEALIEARKYLKDITGEIVNPAISFAEEGEILKQAFDRFSINKEITAEEVLQEIEDKLNKRIAQH